MDASLRKTIDKQRVFAYLMNHTSADTEELMNALGIDLKILVEIIDELRKEDKIEPLPEEECKHK